MRKLFLMAAIGLISAQGSWAFLQEKDWNRQSSVHFLIYYRQAPESFISKVIETSEEYYNSITTSLGFIRYEYWLWDERARIYIYDSLQDYLENSGQPSWSIASAIPKKKEIYTYWGSENFFNTTLPHELAHIILREFVGFDNPAVPFWLDEGVAFYMQKDKSNLSRYLVKETMAKNSLWDLKALTAINPVTIRDRELVEIFYAQAESVVEYLLRKFGREKFVYFCQLLRDHKDLEKSIRICYGFENLTKLSQAWQEYIKNE